MINARPTPAKQRNEVHMILLSTTSLQCSRYTMLQHGTSSDREKNKDFGLKKRMSESSTNVEMSKTEHVGKDLFKLD